jgi:hypothetical protein
MGHRPLIDALTTQVHGTGRRGFKWLGPFASASHRSGLVVTSKGELQF